MARWKYQIVAEWCQLTTGDVAGASGVPATKPLRYVDELEARGVITRTPSEADCRSTLVAATERGLARIATILAEVASAEQDDIIRAQARGMTR